MLGAQVLREGVRVRRTSAFADAKRLRDRREHESRIGERGEPDEPDTVQVVLDELGRRLQAETCLAAPTRSGEGEEPDVLASEQSHHLGELTVAPEERRRLHRKVRLIERPQRRELGVPELVEVFGCLEVLQAVIPEVAHRRIDEVPRRLGQAPDLRVRPPRCVLPCARRDPRSPRP